jgi:hypothetical protein
MLECPALSETTLIGTPSHKELRDMAVAKPVDAEMWSVYRLNGSRKPPRESAWNDCGALVVGE